MKKKEIELLASEIEKARSPKKQFAIYMKSKFAITENEYFLLEATSRFRDLGNAVSSFQALKLQKLGRVNLEIRANVALVPLHTPHYPSV